jgi:cysteate synthase
MGRYVLRCVECGREYEDDGFRLRCDADHKPSLLRTEYQKRNFSLKGQLPGMFKYYDFLPVDRTLEGGTAPITYKSEALAGHLGLQNLYIIFNGYWPERNAFMKTASFKELEAPSVLARTPKGHNGTIVVASAGNTGRAFAHICSRNRIPLLLVIPEESADQIWSVEPFRDNVKLICAGGRSDYYDAITLAGKIINLDGFFPEGGAANVARRDGMATTVLDCSHTAGRIPDHYFQAIGSGTGGIAAWECCLRLLDEGGYGQKRMKLHLSQNLPFIPITESWKSGLKTIPTLDEDIAKKQIDKTCAKVLSNRRPPYSIRGGVYDVLNASSGYTYSVTNDEAFLAMRAFEEYEGIDICPEAGVAIGSLIQAVEQKTVDRDDLIALNITGGGARRLMRDNDVHYLEPFFTFTDEEIHSGGIKERLEDLFVAS